MDRIAIVTGSDRGMGKETALALANNHYSVIMACIDIPNASRAGDEIKSMSGNKNVFVYKIDLSSIASIKQFVQSFLRDFDHINILINNAGIITMDHEITEDGFEKIMAVNTIGPYLLTKLLVPYFPLGEDNRIINVSSWIYKFGKFSIEKMNKYHYVKAYSVSKYSQLLMSLELADGLKERGITVNAVNPGTVRTKIMITNIWFYDFLINILMAPLYIEPKDGAKTCIYLATSDEVKNETGNFYRKCKPVVIPKKFNNKTIRTGLLRYYETIFKENLSFSAC
ncbi:MAG: SDR family oxidoreductase [Treponema sp.]|jgi:NAD(P)-dependent dehydrogenase (short-subunit alcohol dehydrogenase family)|nr:SDR family oxidoreductase [Treponema sp.]